MNSPRFERHATVQRGADIVEFLAKLAPADQRPLPRPGEDAPMLAGNVGCRGDEAVCRVAQGDDVGPGILAAMAGQRPRLAVEIDLAPSHPADLFTTLAGQQQHLERWAKRVADL